MSYRKKNIILLAISIVLFLFSLLTDPIFGNICEPINYDCSKLLKNDTGVLMILFSGAFTLIFFFLLFTKESVFRTWWKFAIPYLILTAILIGISPASNTDIFGLDSELIAWFTSGLFLMISILIIAIKSYKLCRSENQI